MNSIRLSSSFLLPVMLSSKLALRAANCAAEYLFIKTAKYLNRYASTPYKSWSLNGRTLAYSATGFDLIPNNYSYVHIQKSFYFLSRSSDDGVHFD